MLVDTHCHLNFPDKFPDVDAELEFAKASGVERVVVVGVDKESSQKAVELAREFPQLSATAGFHPTYTAQVTADDWAWLEATCQTDEIVAIGEVGLDYHWKDVPPEIQKAALSRQLELARATGKPIVFHCREAVADLLDTIEAGPPLPSFVMHCFSGTAAESQRAAKLGAYFGVDGPVTFPNAGNLREIVAQLPRDRVLLETDSPYLTPHPFRGKPNRPAFVQYVCDAVAGCWGTSFQETEEITTANAFRFFQI